MKSDGAAVRQLSAAEVAPQPPKRAQALNSIKACLDQLRLEATGHRAELAALLIGAAAEACLDAIGEKADEKAETGDR
jgi:hypothetical protein